MSTNTKKKKKSLFKMDEEELASIIGNTNNCLTCGKYITYKVLKSIFCYECSLRYYKQIIALENKSVTVFMMNRGGH